MRELKNTIRTNYNYQEREYVFRRKYIIGNEKIILVFYWMLNSQYLSGLERREPAHSPFDNTATEFLDLNEFGRHLNKINFWGPMPLIHC